MDVELRKLRKKLRGIDRLETHSSLTADEQNKLSLRPQLQHRIAQIVNQIKQSQSDDRGVSENALLSEKTKRDRGDIINVEHKRKSESSSSDPSKYAKIDPEDSFQDDAEDHYEERDVFDKSEESASPASVLQNDQAVNKNTPENNEATSSVVTEVAPVEKSGDVIVDNKLTSKNNSKAVSGQNSGDEVSVKQLRKLNWRGKQLEGHNDTVFCVDSNSHVAITGGRDTMVKVWDVNTCEEIRTLLGHSGTVTAVKIIYPLIKTDADHANNKAEIQNFIGRIIKDAGSEVVRGEDGLCLTASTDCCVKLWNYSSGLILKSIYTFGSVTSIHLMASSIGREGRLAVISGNESGKLQIWDPNDGQELLSKKCHDDSIDHIWASDEIVVTGSKDCLVKVWTISSSEGGDRQFCLNPIFVSDCLKQPSSGETVSSELKVFLGPILALTVDHEESLIFVGDDGPNIKIIDWKKGEMVKLRNHSTPFGYTECLCLTSELLFASAYDMDTGTSAINVFRRPRRRHMKNLRQLFLFSLSLSSQNSIATENEQPQNGRIFAMNFHKDQSASNDSWSCIFGGRQLNCFSTRNDLQFKSDLNLKKEISKEMTGFLEIESDHGIGDDCLSSDEDINFISQSRTIKSRTQILRKRNSYLYWSDWCNLL